MTAHVHPSRDHDLKDTLKHLAALAAGLALQDTKMSMTALSQLTAVGLYRELRPHDRDTLDQVADTALAELQSKTPQSTLLPPPDIDSFQRIITTLTNSPGALATIVTNQKTWSARAHDRGTPLAVHLSSMILEHFNIRTPEYTPLSIQYASQCLQHTVGATLNLGPGYGDAVMDLLGEISSSIHTIANTLRTSLLRAESFPYKLTSASSADGPRRNDIAEYRGQQKAAIEAALGCLDNADDPLQQHRVALGFAAQGSTLAAENIQEALAIFDAIVGHFGNSDHSDLQELVAKVLVNKGLMLQSFEDYASALVAYDEAINRFSGIAAASLREPVARALVNKATTLWQLDRHSEALVICDQVAYRLGASQEPEVQDQVAAALSCKSQRTA